MTPDPLPAPLPQSEADALAQTTKALKAGMTHGDPMLPIIRWQAWQNVCEAGKHFNPGNTGASGGPLLLKTIALCARHALPVPKWAAAAYLAAFEKWRTGEASYLHEAFAVKPLKGRTRAANARTLRHMDAVFNAVHEAHVRDGTPIDEQLFQDVARRLATVGVDSGATVSRLYYLRLEQIKSDPVLALFFSQDRTLPRNTKRRR
jgi:hypothetical protein